MILSNRKLRLIIITLLLLIFCFFIGLISPKAATYSTYMQSANGPYTLEISGKYASFHVENSAGQQTTLFKNWGQGKIIFSYVLGNGSTPTSQINQVTLMQTDGGEFVCDIGQSTQYVDNTTLNNTITAVCDVDLQNNNGITNINFYRNTVAGTLLVIPGLFMEIVTTEQPNVNVNVNQQEVTQAIQNSQTQVHQDIQQSNSIANDIKETLKDSSIDSSQASSSASTWNSKNATNGVITQLLTLPISLLQAIVNGIQTSCSSFSLGSLFGTNITLPCISISSLIGSGLFTTIDILFSGFMILSISKKMIKIFNDFTNLKSNQIDELYGGGN